MRGGFTLVEVVMVLVVSAVLLALAIPHSVWLIDRSAVHSARLELVTLAADARQAAWARGTATTLQVDTAQGDVTIRVGTDTIRRRALGASYGIRLHGTRGTIVYGSTGLGLGAANTTITVTRGRAADTIVIARLGRVR